MRTRSETDDRVPILIAMGCLRTCMAEGRKNKLRRDLIINMIRFAGTRIVERGDDGLQLEGLPDMGGEERTRAVARVSAAVKGPPAARQAPERSYAPEWHLGTRRASRRRRATS